MDKRSLIFVLGLTVALFFVHQYFTSKEPAPQPKTVVVQEEKVPEKPYMPRTEETAQDQEEHYYVLENDYQQLVFSNVGGAITEINLPFKSEGNQKSIVLDIDFDRDMKKESPLNAYFPEAPVENRQLGGYYPLLRRNIVGSKGQQAIEIAPKHYAFNIVSEDPETADLHYNVRKQEKDLIEFEATQGNRRIVKTYSFPKDADATPYLFNMAVRVEGDSRGLYLTSGVPEVELISDSFTPALKYRMNRGQKGVVEKMDLPKTTSSFTSIQPDWVSNSNGFLGIILNPVNEIGAGFTAVNISGDQVPTRLSQIDAIYNLYPLKNIPAMKCSCPCAHRIKRPSSASTPAPFKMDC